MTNSKKLWVWLGAIYLLGLLTGGVKAEGRAA